MASDYSNILVVRGGAIGDFILTLPVLAALRERFPRARVAVLGAAHLAPLALAGGLADEVRPLEARGLAGFFIPQGALPAQWADYFARFELIISYLYDPRAVFASNLARCSPARFIVGPHRPVAGEKLHASDTFLKPLQRLGISGADPVPRLCLKGALTARRGLRALPQADGPEGRACTPLRAVIGKRGGWLAAHPGSGSERKNWPESNWAELFRRLAPATDWHLLLVGGEAERGRVERLAQLWPASRLEIAQSLPLVQLAQRLARCRAYVGHDSGITHLAAALGLPGLALWGETDDAIWRPRSETLAVLRHPGGLAGLPVEQVLTRLLVATAAEPPSEILDAMTVTPNAALACPAEARN
jgi:heptosyltransferase-2